MKNTLRIIAFFTLLAYACLPVHANDNEALNKYEALNYINEKCFNFIELISKKYELDELNDTTWEDYYTYLFYEMEEIDYDNESLCDEMYELLKFFDIYENYAKNEDIIEELNAACNNVALFNSSAKIEEEFKSILPYKYETKNTMNVNIQSVRNSFDLDLGLQYAEKYAKKPNTDNYYFRHGDCANFASQILEASGYEQVKYSDVNLGWWHLKKTNIGIVSHTHSLSWSMGNYFAEYFGICYTTTSNYDFSDHLMVADFVALDHDNDGDWDHIGFVTGKKGYLENGFYNYRIAQHTRNYNNWTYEDENSWEKAEERGETYAIIRI